jgi:hypothetical protein
MKNQFAIFIINDPVFPKELWGPYDNMQEAQETIDHYLGVPDSATIIPVEGDMVFDFC